MSSQISPQRKAKLRCGLWLLLFGFTLCPLVSAQEVMPELLPFGWSEVPTNLPPSLRVFAGESYRHDGLPVRAWRVEVDYSDRRLLARPFLSQAPTGKEFTSELAAKSGALVAINGGYFDMQSRPARTYSLVKSNGQILAQNIARVSRTNGAYPVLRSAFGIRADRTFALDWIGHFGTDILKFPAPLPHTPYRIAGLPDPVAGQPWHDVTDAVGGGPVLLKDGAPLLTYNEEAFFGSGFLSNAPYPRTAVGRTADNRLILFISDGKQAEWSVGLTLPQLAEEMRNLGCTDAMNLDGGGSTTLVVQGSVLNRPSDGRERSVTSILAIVPQT